MFERTRTRTVAFARPFQIEGIDGLLPPGAYEIETDEELIPGLSFTAYRRTRTAITLQTGGLGSTRARQVVTIDPADLEAALALDAQAASGDRGSS